MKEVLFKIKKHLKHLNLKQILDVTGPQNAALPQSSAVSSPTLQKPFLWLISWKKTKRALDSGETNTASSSDESIDTVSEYQRIGISKVGWIHPPFDQKVHLQVNFSPFTS